MTRSLLPLLLVCGASAALMAAGGVASAQAAARESGFILKTLRWSGRDARYVVFVPPGYTGSKTWPAIIFLNGAGECGTDGLKHTAVGLGSAIQWKVEEWPFLVIFPQKPTVESRWADHDGMVMAMLEATQREYKVDAQRVYLTGLSQGGYGTWDLAAKHPDLFAAIAPICGGGDPGRAGVLARMPIWCFHGDADTAVPLRASVEMVDAVKAAGGSPKLTVYPGVGHNSWDKAYREEKLADWFLQHSRATK